MIDFILTLYETMHTVDVLIITMVETIVTVVDLTKSMPVMK